jgi:hypothetical protein
MLSKALKTQQENKDTDYDVAILDLQGEVDKLRESLEEKENEITSLKEAFMMILKRQKKTLSLRMKKMQSYWNP